MYTEYVSIKSLPSYQIGTPDPRLFAPDIGERLHITWNLPSDLNPEIDNVFFCLKLYFGNKEEEEVWLTLNTNSGTYIYSLMNDDYWEKQGIFTYKIDLFANGTFIDEWCHQLYVERLQIGSHN